MQHQPTDIFSFTLQLSHTLSSSLTHTLTFNPHFGSSFSFSRKQVSFAELCLPFCLSLIPSTSLYLLTPPIPIEHPPLRNTSCYTRPAIEIGSSEQ